MNHKAAAGVGAVILAIIAMKLLLPPIDGVSAPESIGITERPTKGAAPATETRAIASFVPPRINSVGPDDVATAFLDSRLKEYGPAQAAIIKRAARLLGDEVPVVLLEKELSESDAKVLDKELAEFAIRELALNAQYTQSGTALAQQIFKRGGGQVWEDRLTTIPDPTGSGASITRRLSPFDNPEPDVFVSETGVDGPNGVPISVVVTLRTETNPLWAQTVSEHKKSTASFRQEVILSIESHFHGR